MEEKEKRVKEIEQSTIKAKSKVSAGACVPDGFALQYRKFGC